MKNLQKWVRCSREKREIHTFIFRDRNCIDVTIAGDDHPSNDC